MRISSVNVIKLEFPEDLVTFTEEILNGKHFLCRVVTVPESYQSSVSLLLYCG